VDGGVISVGDVVAITIFEAGAGGLFIPAEPAPSGTFKQLNNDTVSGNIFVTEITAPHDPGFGDLTGGIGNVSISGNDFWAYGNVGLNVGGTGPGGDSGAHCNAPAGSAAQSVGDHATWAGGGINFKAIDTSQIGVAPTGLHPYQRVCAGVEAAFRCMKLTALRTKPCQQFFGSE
jgi:hypothetical protein